MLLLLDCFPRVKHTTMKGELQQWRSQRVSALRKGKLGICGRHLQLPFQKHPCMDFSGNQCQPTEVTDPELLKALKCNPRLEGLVVGSELICNTLGFEDPLKERILLCMCICL